MLAVVQPSFFCPKNVGFFDSKLGQVANQTIDYDLARARPAISHDTWPLPLIYLYITSLKQQYCPQKANRY